MTFEFSDGDGFISIVNADKYKGFVDNDWGLDQLFNHFVDQMNDRNIIIWTSNEDGGNEWNIHISNRPSLNDEFRHFSFPIVVTNECLYLVPYDDLTMVAQFESEVISAKYNSHLKIEMTNGSYNVTIRQMFDPKNFDYESDIIHFEMIFNSVNTIANQKADKVFWWTE
ncbi:hypothetical protein ABIB40_003155 [Pedobacter sp. UYP30]|uniref:hypothetical protein n=1 Tax=Pedobacter sp. UYP30 TaxID=1756400 RepID=UPI0033988993